jgi:hemoglobin
MKNDIKTSEDIDVCMHAFYQKLLNDELTKPIFEYLDLTKHMPKIIAFWEFILLDKEGYKTNVFEQHVHLNLEKNHFITWLRYFNETIDEMYEGEKCEMAKQRALMLANTFYYKLSGEFYSF